MGDLFSGIASAVGDVTGAIGNIISPISSLISGGASYLGTQDQIQAAQANQAAANAFSAQQYATRYQTTVKDLQAAGLNPMLAVANGPGSAPSSVAPAPTFNKLGNAASSAVDAASRIQGVVNQRTQNDLTNSEIQKNDFQYKLLDAQTAKTISEIPVSQAIINEKEATVKSILQNIRESNSRIGLNTAQTANTQADFGTFKARGDYYQKYGLTPEKMTQMGSQIVNSASSAVNLARPKSRINYQPTINNYESQ